MPRITRWSQLVIGSAALVGAVGVAAAIIVFAKVGALHGAATTLYMVTDRAGGVIGGTDVWLNGQKVGVVDAVTLRPVTSDTAERVLIRMRILNTYLPYVRRNSGVRIQPGGSLIGAPVVAISEGTRQAAPIRVGDTLRALGQVENRPASADLGSIGDSVVAIAAEFRNISGQLDTTLGAVRGVVSRTRHEVSAVSAAVDRYQARALHSRGSLARAMQDSALQQEVQRVAAVTDSLEAAASASHGVGRFTRDSTLVVHIRHTLASTERLESRLRAYMGDPTGGDSALERQLERTHRVLDSLTADLKHHPFRYLPF